MLHNIEYSTFKLCHLIKSADDMLRQRTTAVVLSGVHVLLDSLLVDQKNCPVSETGQKFFGQSLIFFPSVSLLEGEQKKIRD